MLTLTRTFQRVALTLILCLVALGIGVAGTYSFTNTLAMADAGTWLLLKIWPVA